MNVECGKVYTEGYISSIYLSILNVKSGKVNIVYLISSLKVECGNVNNIYLVSGYMYIYLSILYVERGKMNNMYLSIYFEGCKVNSICLFTIYFEC